MLFQEACRLLTTKFLQASDWRWFLCPTQNDNTKSKHTLTCPTTTNALISSHLPTIEQWQQCGSLQDPATHMVSTTWTPGLHSKSSEHLLRLHSLALENKECTTWTIYLLPQSTHAGLPLRQSMHCKAHSLQSSESSASFPWDEMLRKDRSLMIVVTAAQLLSMEVYAVALCLDLFKRQKLCSCPNWEHEGTSTPVHHIQIPGGILSPNVRYVVACRFVPLGSGGLEARPFVVERVHIKTGLRFRFGLDEPQFVVAVAFEARSPCRYFLSCKSWRNEI